MGRFFINKLIFTGKKGRSVLEFGERLTLITGPSDTGKSYIYKSIYYLLGAKAENNPFDSSIGYDTISMELRVGDGNISVTREIDSPKFIVVRDGIKENYSLKGKKGIDKFYLELLNLPEDFKVPKNESGQTQAFSFRTMRSLFMVKEEDTETDKSILLPPMNMGETAFLSGLLYFLYNQDFSEYDPEDSKRTQAAKKAAIQKYILRNIRKLKKDKEDLESQIIDKELTKDNAESLLSNLEDELNKTNNSITSLLNNSRPLNLQILRLEDEIRQKKVLINRYKDLESQYVSDIERLGFIVEGEKIIHNHKSPSNCPFCNNEMEDTEEQSYLEASKAEVKKILINSSDLSQTIIDLEKDLTELNERLNDFIRQRNSVQETIKTELTPQKISIDEKIKQYTIHIQATEKLEWLNNILSNMDGDLSNIDEDMKTTTEYKPKELFPEKFVTSIGNNYEKILRDIQYEPIESVSFDMKPFDIVVNNQEKRSHGKGYRALMNSVLILAMREYINDNAIINPRFYLIDSPLHGLAMPNGAEHTDNVRKGFINYLTNNYNDDQLIIIENISTHELSEKVFSDPKIKLIEFTQDENEGRYGLLDGIRKK